MAAVAGKAGDGRGKGKGGAEDVGNRAVGRAVTTESDSDVMPAKRKKLPALKLKQRLKILSEKVEVKLPVEGKDNA